MVAPSSLRSDISYSLPDRYLAEHGSVFLTGIQALARLPLDQLRADRAAGWRTAALVTGYPGSPLGGYGEAVAEAAALASDLPVVFRQALNEELAAGAIMGSQLASLQPDRRHDGVIGIWYGKAPGVERAADALRHAVFAGTSSRGGAVALVGDDPAAKSSTVPSSSAGLLADMHMPLLYPGDPAEALDLGRHAIALSRTTGLWVALKIVADVADATASVDLHPERIVPVIPTVDGARYRHSPDGKLLTPHTLDIEREIVEVRYELATRYASENRLNRVTVDAPDAWIGIVASGITAREVREALRRIGLAGDDAIAGAGIRLLEMGMPFPFDPRTIRGFARGLDQIMVIEEKRPTMESLIKDTLYDLADRPVVVGKHDEGGRRLFAEHGALDADTIVGPLRRRLETRVADRLAPEPAPRRALIPLAVNRTPYYCSGCPHNRSTEAPPGALVGAGIGCHTMAVLMDPERFGDIAGVTCMGSEGAQWVGMAPFVERSHFIQNVGDGTYFHSAQLAVQNSVAAGVNITYKLLYNGTVAMTGGQDPQGQLTVGKVAEVLLAQGVTRVLVTTDEPDRYHGRGRAELPPGVEVWNRDRLLEAQQVLASVPGVTVLIHDQRCAAEARRDRKRGLAPTPTQRVVINHRICEGCGDCGRVSNCLSVQPLDTAFGRKTTIDQTTCNLDYSCLEGDCPSFMTLDAAEPGPIGSLLRRLRPGRRVGDDDAGVAGRDAVDAPPEVASPDPVVPTDAFAVRICGIGGTGVVTVAQIVGTAAMLDGYHVRGLDQIGLSQKAGPVVSDVRMSRSEPTATNRLGAGQANLLLAFDQLVAASGRGLLTASPAITTVVGSLTPVPTGEMIAHPEVALPDAGDLVSRIGEVTRTDASHWADAQAVTTDLLGSATTANVFVVGMAVQAGCLPVDPARIEEAIALNGVAVAANTAAFRWGRVQVADPAAVDAARRRSGGGEGSGGPTTEPAAQSVPSVGALGKASAAAPPAAISARIAALGRPALTAQLELFAAELVAWGDESTASGWLDVVERVSAAERSVTVADDCDATGSSADSGGALTATVAANLYKLTAYKDEYEVARLMTDPDGTAAVESVRRAGDRVAWKLHPPMLEALGMKGKISVGAWAEPAVRLLAKGKRLRGTPADPFGHTEMRRLERALPGEYVEAVDRVLALLSADNLDRAVALGGLPDRVRGYEELKLRRIGEYRDELAAALAELGA